MISYIANTENNGIIQKICKMKNILILSSMNEEIDVKQYMKETKVNFNLIKHFIVDLSLLKNTETEIIESIYNFSKLYGKTRVIILATNYDEQNAVLTNLYDLGFYNIINEFDTDIIEQKLLIALSQNGLQKNMELLMLNSMMYYQVLNIFHSIYHMWELKTSLQKK